MCIRDSIEYKQMLQGIRDRVAAAKRRGESLEQIQAARPTARWDEQWGGGFLPPDAFVAIVFDALD